MLIMRRIDCFSELSYLSWHCANPRSTAPCGRVCKSVGDAWYTHHMYTHDEYRMRFNFCGVYILRICNFRVFRVFKFAVAGYSGVEIFADIRSESVYHNSIRQLQRCKISWTRCWIRLMMLPYQMERFSHLLGGMDAFH